MIKILILSRSDLHPHRKNKPQEEIQIGDFNNEAWSMIGHNHYVLFQEAGGPLLVLKDRTGKNEVNISTLLKALAEQLR